MHLKTEGIKDFFNKYWRYMTDIFIIDWFKLFSKSIYLFIFIRVFIEIFFNEAYFGMISTETKNERASLNIKSLKLKEELNKTREKKAREKIPKKIVFSECVIIDVRVLSCCLNIILYSLIIRNKKSYCRRKRV